MPNLTLMGYPLATLFLYFVFYSVVGWAMETAYCSLHERRFVPRGFLHGPLCPIYGVGVLLMILFFKPLAGNLLIFYAVSTVTMSAWEYFVGWFLETTTHVKYWDYSMYRFNLKGRVCLWVCLVWGVLSYVAIFWIHPPVEDLFTMIPPNIQTVAALVLLAAVVVDAAFTIRELALMAKVVSKLQTLGGELQVQAALGKAELSDKLSGVKETVSDKLTGAKDALTAVLPDVSETTDKLKNKYADLLAAAERRTRRFRAIYADFRAPKVDSRLRDAIRSIGRELQSRRHNREER